MFESPEKKHVLIAPDHVAERIDIKDRPKDLRHHFRKIENRHEVHAHQAKDLHEVLEIPEVNAY
jgi:hypothetical protein